MRERITADPSQAQAPVLAEEAAPVISANFKRMTSWKNAAENKRVSRSNWISSSVASNGTPNARCILDPRSIKMPTSPE
jgi:hypothetical protein